MKAYKIVYKENSQSGTDSEKVIVHWHASQVERNKERTRVTRNPDLILLGVGDVEIPTKKGELLQWLNINMNRRQDDD